MSNNGNGAGQKERDDQYIDPDGYWIDADRKCQAEEW
jgi:hypothetical protein